MALAEKYRENEDKTQDSINKTTPLVKIQQE